MKTIALLLAITIFSCSGEDMPDKVSLYDLQIVTEINTTVYNYVGGVESIDDRMYDKWFYMKTTVQIAEIKKQYPAGTTVTDVDNGQRRTVKTKRVSHRLKVSK